MNGRKEMRGAWCVVRDGRSSRTTHHAPRRRFARWAAVCLAGFAGTVCATNLPPATVSFLDGSFLRGEIGALNSDVLRWLHPNARAPIEFSTTNLNLIRLPARSASLPTNAGPVCRVVLASGDEFEGHLLSLDADSFEIETWFAGRLRGRRAGLQSLAFYGSSQTALYDGPRAAEEWKISTGAANVNRVGVNLFGGLGNLVVRPAVPVAVPAPAAVPQFRLVEPAKPVERRAFTVEELARLSNDAEKSATVAVFLKTDLVKEALKVGQTSEAALEKWFADFKDPNDWAKDEAKAARFKVMLRAEVDVLVRRLQGRAAPFVVVGADAAVAPLPLPAPVLPKTVAPAEPKRPVLQVVPRAAPLNPAVDPVAQAVKAEVERAAGKAAPVALPAIPPKLSSGAAAERIAKGKPSTFDITRMSTAARFSATITDYLKSDLVQLAVKSDLVKADAVKTELDKQATAGVEVRSLIWREGALLTARLLRELEHLKQESSATTLAHAYLILGRISGGVPAVVAAVSVPSHAAALVMTSVTAAQQATTADQFIKSELVRAAADAGMTSERALERWFGDYTDAADLERDKAKGDRFRALVKAESALLGTRLLRTLGAGVGAAEADNLERQHAQAQAELARGALAAAQAEALAQARVRALDALRLNNPNLALAMGAEGALAGRAALPGAQNPNAAWTFRDGAYYSTGVGTLGRECHLPTKARVEFDLAWKGQPYFRFSFYTRSTEHYDYSDGWQFYISSSGYIYSMRRSGVGATSSSGARVPQMLAKNTVRFTFLVNTEAETVTLLADGEKVHEWKSLGSPGPGTGVVFYNYNANSRVRVSDIRVAPWDGRERDAAPPGAPGDDPDKLVEVPPADSAVVEFANRDRASGTLHGIRDGKLAFNPAGTKLEIPLARAALISFPVGDAPALPKVEGVQVTLHRNERLTLALEKWEAEEIIAVSPVFGRLKLKPESVRALRFNPSATRGPVDEWSGP